MLISRSLALPFLLPAWTAPRICQSRCYHPQRPHNYLRTKQDYDPSKGQHTDGSTEHLEATDNVLLQNDSKKRHTRRGTTPILSPKQRSPGLGPTRAPLLTIRFTRGEGTTAFVANHYGTEELGTLVQRNTPSIDAEKWSQIKPGGSRKSNSKELKGTATNVRKVWHKPRQNTDLAKAEMPLALPWHKSEVQTKPENHVNRPTRPHSEEAITLEEQAVYDSTAQPSLFHPRLNRPYVGGNAFQGSSKAGQVKNVSVEEIPIKQEEVEKRLTHDKQTGMKGARKGLLYTESTKEQGSEKWLTNDNKTRLDLSQSGPTPRSSYKDTTTKKSSEQRLPSLFELLFPVEARKRAQKQAEEDNSNRNRRKTKVPRLELPDFGDLSRSFVSLNRDELTRPDQERVKHLRLEQITVLMLDNASTGLIDADFRQIAPHGEHIEEWRGPGDILKIVPNRDYETLVPKPRYFLLFSNANYAQLYRQHVRRLHQVFTAHSSNSILAPLSSAMATPEETQSLLKNYTLSASQRLQWETHSPPYSSTLRHLIEHSGYPLLMNPVDRTNRSVLFWVTGYNPSAQSVELAIARDGQNRGLQWTAIPGGKTSLNNKPEDGCGIELIDRAVRRRGKKLITKWDPEHNPEHNPEKEVEESGHSRWIITLQDETEARRFVRCWHMAPYPLNHADREYKRGDVVPLMHAEILW